MKRHRLWKKERGIGFHGTFTEKNYQLHLVGGPCDGQIINSFKYYSRLTNLVYGYIYETKTPWELEEQAVVWMDDGTWRVDLFFKGIEFKFIVVDDEPLGPGKDPQERIVRKGKLFISESELPEAVKERCRGKGELLARFLVRAIGLILIG